MDEILDKVDSIIFKLKNSKDIKRVYELKKEINSNENIKILLNEFNESKENNSNLLYSKNRLYNNETIKEYLSIQNNLDYIILHFNKSLSSLISNKLCNK
jgi:cell fate (sporulation/competence/biofilm development) regulator YlbF (YheA/YmcA/DUF963 family)